MAERQRQLNFGGGQIGRAAAIGGSVPSGSGRGPAAALLDGLIASDKEQRALEKQRIKEQRAEVEARQKEALKAFTTSTQIGIEDNINRISNETPNNPAAIKKKGEALISGLMGTLPEIVRPVFNAKATKSLNQKIAVANQKAIKIVQGDAEIQAATLQAQLLGKLRGVSKNRFSENDDLRIASEEELLSVQAEMLAPFMETAEDFEGNEFDLFTAKEIDKQVDNIDVISLEAGIEGWFDTQESMAVAFQTIVDGDFRIPNATGEDEFVAVNALDALPDNGRAMLARLNTKMTARNSVDDEQDRLDDESRDLEQALNLFDAYETIENPNSEKVRITPGEVEEMVLAGELDPAKAIPLLKAATAPEVINNDPLLFSMLTSMIQNDLDIEAFVNDSSDRLKPETLWRLRKENKANQARLAGVVQSEREDLIKQEEKSMVRIIDTVGPFGLVDPDQNNRIAEAVTAYNRRVDAGEDPVEVRRELVRRARNRAVGNDEFTGALLKPRFMPMTRDNITTETLKQGAGRLVANFKTGKISKVEFTIQKKLFIEWTRQVTKKEKAEELVLLEEARKKTNGK